MVAWCCSQRRTWARAWRSSPWKRAPMFFRRSASVSMPFMRMMRTRVKASSSSLLMGLLAISRQVNFCFSKGHPLASNRLVRVSILTSVEREAGASPSRVGWAMRGDGRHGRPLRSVAGPLAGDLAYPLDRHARREQGEIFMNAFAQAAAAVGELLDAQGIDGEALAAGLVDQRDEGAAALVQGGGDAVARNASCEFVFKHGVAPGRPGGGTGGRCGRGCCCRCRRS